MSTDAPHSAPRRPVKVLRKSWLWVAERVLATNTTSTSFLRKPASPVKVLEAPFETHQNPSSPPV